MTGTEKGTEIAGRKANSDGKRPRWVVVTGVVIAVLVAMVVVMMLVGGGKHGPGRHFPPAGHKPSATMQVSPGNMPPSGMNHGG